MLTVDIRGYRHPKDSRLAISPCQFEVRPGRIRCLVGPSGAGKTTLVRALLGTAEGELDGDIRYFVDGRETSVQALCASGAIGYLTDGTCLLPWLTVSENLYLPARLNPHLAQLAPEAMDLTLARMQLEEATLKKRPHELSFGMRRRVALARVLLHRPRFLFLDEAFTGLDPRTRLAVAGAVRDYVDQNSAACLLVTHELETAADLGDDHTVMSWSGVVTSVTPPVTAQSLYELLGAEVQPTSRPPQLPLGRERLA